MFIGPDSWVSSYKKDDKILLLPLRDRVNGLSNTYSQSLMRSGDVSGTYALDKISMFKYFGLVVVVT